MEAKNDSLQVQGSSAITTFNFFDPVQFETMQRVCKLFSSSELVPDMYRTDLTVKNEKVVNPENKAMANCMIAIEMAQRIGASPLMIMQNMNIIYGRPAWSSKFLIATVNTCGRFNPLQYRITSLGMVGKLIITVYDKKWIAGANGGKGYYKNDAKEVEFDGTKIENLQFIAFSSKKGSVDILESAPVDIKMSIQEGWYNKPGSKWPTMTKQMGIYRAATMWTNAYAPELSMGMKTAEEIMDIEDIEYEDVTNRVEGEKAANANKTTLTLDPDPGPKPGENTPPPAPEAASAPEGAVPPATNPTSPAEVKPTDQPATGDGSNLFAGNPPEIKKRNF